MSNSVISTLIIVIFAILIALSYIIGRDYPPVHKVTQVWETRPIVSVYVPDVAHGGFCNSGYEHVLIRDEFTISSVTEGPCGCAQNPYSFQSTNANCPTDFDPSESCLSLSALSEVPSVTWRESGICIKRGGLYAASLRNGKYRSRPHPDHNGHCPSDHQSCGSLCVPTGSQCPVTNMMVLSVNASVPNGQGWESVGIFGSAGVALYVRRNQTDELPIVDIVARLTELTTTKENVRGQCYLGSPQVFNKALVSNPDHLWSYTADLPPVCDLVDPRYNLIDTIDLESHYLQNLQLNEPTCKVHELYPLHDPRYQSARDPDYLNSGVKCGTRTTLPCLRDPYHSTDCAARDDICDGVVHQNVCGAYTHAVRSAFSGSSVSLGLYFTREIEWSDHCKVSKAFVMKDILDKNYGWSLYCVVMIVIFVLNVTMYYAKALGKDGFYLSFLLPTVMAYHLWEESGRYRSIRLDSCTDPFTADVLLSGQEARVVCCFWLTCTAKLLILILHCMTVPAPVRLAPTPAPALLVSSAPSSAVVAGTATSVRPTPTTLTPTSGSATTTAVRTSTVSVVATPVAVQMVQLDRGGVYEPLLSNQNDEMV